MSRPEESWSMAEHREHAAQTLAALLAKRDAAHGVPRTPDMAKPERPRNRPHWAKAKEKKA